jgi:hypothetical protein
MYKKILRDICILLCLAALVCSTSRTCMKYIVTLRDNEKWWGYNQLRGGNLAGISDLAFLKTFYCDLDNYNFVTRPAYVGPRKIALYLAADSYTWALRDTNFAGISRFFLINRYDGGLYHLDNSKKNILLIAISENLFRAYFSNQKMLNTIHDSSISEKDESGAIRLYKPVGDKFAGNRLSAFLPGIGADLFFNKNINQNLQCNLTNYNIMMGMFQYKAAINYYFFDRASGDVVISNDKKFLFYKSTVSKTDSGSSYFPLTRYELNNLVQNLNETYDYYKADGFSEVYLSIIPNTASLKQPEGYNSLIPLIQNDARLKMKVIDVYYSFMNSPEELFYHGDTHWNLAGKQKWVDAVNKILINDDH